MGTAWYFVGVDLGQARDYTAIAVLERAETQGEWDAVQYAHRKTVKLRLRYLERMALGTTYPEIVDRVKQITRSADLAGRCHLAVDATGVGRPVVDLLRKAGLHCTMLAATITGGDAETRSEGYYRVPKRDLITGLQILLQNGGLQIAGRMAYAAELAAEMAEMRVKVTAAGNTQFGVWRESAHDDLVLAVALACWGARKVYPSSPLGDEAYWRRKDEADWARGLGKWAERKTGRLV